METPEQVTIRDCLGSLDGKYRQVLTLAFSHGMSHGEISDHLGVPLGTVKTWARRGLMELKAAYEQAGADQMIVSGVGPLSAHIKPPATSTSQVWQ